MFYLVNAKTGLVVESLCEPPTIKSLQADADFYGCELYVITGEHYGMTARPTEKEQRPQQLELVGVSED